MTIRQLWLTTVFAGLALVACDGKKSSRPGDAGSDARDALQMLAEAGGDMARADSTVDLFGPTDAFAPDGAGPDGSVDSPQDVPAQPLEAGLDSSQTWLDGGDGERGTLGLDATDREPEAGSDLGPRTWDAGLGSSPLSVTPSLSSPLALGQADKGTTGVTSSITITNTGKAPTGNLQISANDPQFVLVDDHCSGAPLAASASCQVGVALRPTQTGIIDGSITVMEGATTEVSIPITGIGLPYYLLAAAPPSFDFGRWWIDSAPPPQSFTVLNAGALPSGPLVVSLQMARENTRLSLSKNTCAGLSLAPGETCALEIAFDAKGCFDGYIAGALVITPAVGTPLSISLSAACSY